jgi:hypothetical protein
MIMFDIAAAASVRQLAEDLSHQGRELADNVYRDFTRRSRGDRPDVEIVYGARQFSASADLFLRMVRDNRPASELRDSLSVLRNELGRMDRYMFGQSERRRMFNLIRELGEELRLEDRGRFGPPDRGRFGRTSGRMRWSGTVDEEIVITIRGSSASTRVLRGRNIQGEHYSFESPLPPREVSISLNKHDGRGSVEILERPSRHNNYSAVVRIRDEKGGADRYEFELSW